MKTPDIEIYVKDLSTEQLSNWLNEFFDTVGVQLQPSCLEEKHSISGTVSRDSANIPVVITPWAAGKSFCSIWFKSSETSWENDEACAQSLLEFFDLEVRYAASSWEEGEDESGEYWISVTRNEKKLIRWG